MTAPPSTPPLDVLIVGAGFGGLGLGIRLAQQRGTRFAIAEQAAGVGGTWYHNRYPGAACDIPSHLYSLSFAPNPHWSRKYPPQAEIEAYLNDCVRCFGLGPALRLNTRVAALEWLPDRKAWRAQFEGSDGTSSTLDARAVVIATGPLSRPAMPAIDGIESFGGRLMHSAQWPRDFAARGQRIAVIGTGASAIQLVPALAPQAAQLSLFQRTSAWIMPRADAPIGPLQRRALVHLPGVRQLWRAAIYLQHEIRVPGFVRQPKILQAAEKLALRHLHAQVPPGALRDALTPNYRMGCKRILIADDFYPVLQLPQVRLVSDAIERIVPEGIRTRDGSVHRFDAIVTATGFDAASPTPPFAVRGPDGATLHAAWAHGAEGYLGTMIAGLPNLFTIIGPNTGLGHNSMVFMIESQINFILDALRRMHRHAIGALAVRPEAQAQFNREVQQRMAATVWTRGGCKSWYQAADGRITTLWPGSTLEYRRRTRRLDMADFVATPA